MSKLLFLEEGHKYMLGGEELPSVSEVCRFISREIYSDIAQRPVDLAAARGTKVHKATEVLDKYGSCEVTEDIAPYLQAYLLFRKDHPCTWERIEYASHHPEALYAGTLDRLGTVDGKRAIVDIKSTANIDPAHRKLYTAQLNLYRRMLPDAVEALYVLQLKKDGTYKLWPLEIEDTLADACLSLHAALKKRKRKKKGVPENE